MAHALDRATSVRLIEMPGTFGPGKTKSTSGIFGPDLYVGRPIWAFFSSLFKKNGWVSRVVNW